MKRPKLRKASKRISCSKRYKIQKKVREHNKKLRKEAKKKGLKKHVKKDPGVPNSAPFKEEVLREAEQRRLQIEEEKERKRQAKKEERAQKRKKEKEAAVKEAEPSAKKARKDTTENNSVKRAANKNSKQHLCSELNKVIDASDVVIEVLDARDPLGCRCPQLEKAVLLGGKRKLLFVLTKIDLVPKENVEKWIECLQREFPVVAFKASTQMREKTVKAKRKRVLPSNEVLDRSKGAACFGNECLAELLTAYAAKMQSEVALKVGVVGFPNVGKSSLINNLKGMMACHVGIAKGTTKTVQEVHMSKTVKLIDSPGVVASPSNPAASMALRSLQVEEGQETVLDAVNTLLKQCDKSQVMLQYTVPDFRNSLEFLTLLAKKRGFLQKGGVPNTEQAAITFLTDWTGAKLSYHCKVPGNYSHPNYVTEEVITEMQDGWDLDKVKAGNMETLKGFKFPNLASSIGFVSRGPTAGLLTVAPVPEERPPAEREAQHNSENDEAGETEELHETEEVEKLQKTVKDKPSKVHFQPVPVDISLSTVYTDDAYDFNTDFK
ncbi:guanine nucleotide-binding protein-like 3 [Gambusia affinis]|uniref:guanine nucleotide-binding protein-like 3 n=1 Tax=Gambusia affinis TaxID=33528 RepID=UPI001CDD60BC|nr:guanine nucleotide-binding protein-like 3 [Gambusia affinis]XP_043978299.1 guanine nucleotide-binding protein-like 3 [Gambusia affinis]XP_043978300.1 guanine nucleotide-binding protein-like 3 [Gambusia affinis]XP_043978301.1 guanine nucleotide-binding protein-like 3 [Gambusia affinis]XP_043978302.1 guanine nucleotide-binding protein-like 3 [Gambusia affinis]